MAVDPTTVVSIAQHIYQAVQFIIEFINIKEENKVKAKELIKRVIRIQAILEHAKDNSPYQELLNDMKRQLSNANEIACTYRTNRHQRIITRKNQIATTQQPTSQITTTDQSTATIEQPAKECCPCCPYSCACSVFQNRLKIYWDYKTLKANFELLDRRITQAGGDVVFGIVINLENLVDEVLNVTTKTYDKVVSIDATVNNVHAAVIRIEEHIEKMEEGTKLNQYSEDQLQQFINENLKQPYIRNYSKIKRLMTDNEYPIANNYINLFIVQNERVQSNEFKNELNKTGLTTHEQLSESKKPIHVKDLFKHCDKEVDTKRLVVYGRAGIGKTTFCQYIVHQWAIGELYQQFKCLLWIRLRNLMNKRYRSDSSQPYRLIDIVKRECFETHDLESNKEEKLRYILKNLSSDILWILDGYDEIQIPDHLQDVFNELMNKKQLILTSRPTATIPYRNDGQFEIGGLTEENVENYIKQFFNNQSKFSANIKAFLKSSPNVWDICHTPICLEIFCTSWSLQQRQRQTERMTISRFYNIMIEWILRCSLLKKTSEEVVRDKGKDSVFEEFEKELEILDEIAFRCIASNDPVCVRSDVCQNIVKEKCGGKGKERDEWRKKVMNVGVLKPAEGEKSAIEEDKNYEFIHLSFQEFFVARQLKRMLESKSDEGIEFIRQNKYNSRYHLVFAFLAGLLTREGADTFFEEVNKEPRDLLYAKHSQLLVVCLEETDIQKHETILKQINQHLISIIQIREKDAHEYELRFLELLGRSYGVLSQNVIEQTILIHLKSDHICNILLCINKMQNCSINVFIKLLYLINDESFVKQYRELQAICDIFCTLFSSSLITHYVENQLVNGDTSMENNFMIIMTSIIYTRGKGWRLKKFVEVISHFELLLSTDFKLKLQELILAKANTYPYYGLRIFDGLNKSLKQSIVDQLLSWISDVDELKCEKAIEQHMILCTTLPDICVRLISIYINTPYDNVKNLIERICWGLIQLGGNSGGFSFDTVQELDKMYFEHQSNERLTALLPITFFCICGTYPEYLSSLSQFTTERIITFCQNYLLQFNLNQLFNKHDAYYIKCVHALMHNSDTGGDKIMPLLLTMLKTGNDDQCIIAAAVLGNLDENLDIQYDIVQALLNVIQRNPDYSSSVIQTLCERCRTNENMQAVKVLETAVLQCENIYLKSVAGEVLRTINDEILLELFEQLKVTNDDTLENTILTIFSDATTQAAKHPEIIAYCLECIRADKNTTDLLKSTIGKIWAASPREILLEQVLNVDSHECTQFIIEYVAKNASNCVILNQLLGRVDDYVEILIFFCSKIRHPRLICNLLYAVQSSETSTKVKNIVTKILFQLGTYDKNNDRTNLFTVISEQNKWPHNNNEDRNYRPEVNAVYLSYFSDELIKHILGNKATCISQKLFSLVELLRVYLLTEKSGWLDLLIYQALKHSIAITVDKKEKYVLIHEDKEIKRELVKEDKIFDNIIRKLSERTNQRGLTIDENNMNIVQNTTIISIEDEKRVASNNSMTDVE